MEAMTSSSNRTTVSTSHLKRNPLDENQQLRLLIPEERLLPADGEEQVKTVPWTWIRTGVARPRESKRCQERTVDLKLSIMESNTVLQTMLLIV